MGWSAPKRSGDNKGEPRMVDIHLSMGWPVAPDIAAAAAMAGNWNACGGLSSGVANWLHSDSE